MTAQTGNRLSSWYRTHRREATIGVIVGAAALLLLAAFLAFSFAQDAAPIAGGPSAEPSTSADPSVSPDPSAAPSDAPDPSAAPSDDPNADEPEYELLPYAPLPPSWGMVVVDDLNVRSGPEDDAPIIGSLNDGDLVQVIEAGQRLQVLADGITGWVSAGDDAGDPWIRAIRTPWRQIRLAGIASNGSGYLGFGIHADLETPPYEGGFQRPLFLVSDDGSTWEESHDGVPGEVVAGAATADGYVVVSTNGYGGSFLSFSSDGRTWSEPVGTDGQQHAVAHGPAGWLVVSFDAEQNLIARRSTDGRTWTDPVAVGGDFSVPSIEASSSGYVIFDRNGYTGFASSDGVIWNSFGAPVNAAGRVADVELVGDELLLVTVDRDAGTTIHRGTFGAHGAVTFDSTVDGSVFGGAQVDSIAAGPDGLVAFGWDTEALAPITWTSQDGGTWARHEVEGAFGGMTGPEPVHGDDGWIAIGQSDGLPSLWRSADGVSWDLAGGPAALPTPEPVCPDADGVTTLDLMFLGADARECYGDASLTVRGWVPLIEGLGGCCYPISEPAWLAGPYPTGWISPAEIDRMALNVYVPPNVDVSAFDEHTWVEVTGHFADAAADDCRHIPEPSVAHRLESQEAARDLCAGRFVVERVVASTAP
jgi:hypothetical protein